MVSGRRRTLPLTASILSILIVAGIGAIWFAHDGGVDARNDVAPIAADMARDEFERRVRQYLLDNPEVLIEAMERHDEREEAAAQDARRMVLQERSDEIFHDPATPVGGNPDGDVTLVEFLDYNCPYCRRVAPIVAEAAAADPQLRVAYKEFPILGPGSVFASKAALAADRQDKYVEFHEALMGQDGAVDEEVALDIAAEVGLDIERLQEDVDDPDIAAAIERNLSLAQGLGIRGTPAFIVGERIIPGAANLTTLQAAIQEAREELPDNR